MLDVCPPGRRLSPAWSIAVAIQYLSTLLPQLGPWAPSNRLLIQLKLKLSSTSQLHASYSGSTASARTALGKDGYPSNPFDQFGNHSNRPSYRYHSSSSPDNANMDDDVLSQFGPSDADILVTHTSIPRGIIIQAPLPDPPESISQRSPSIHNPQRSHSARPHHCQSDQRTNNDNRRHRRPTDNTTSSPQHSRNPVSSTQRYDPESPTAKGGHSWCSICPLHPIPHYQITSAICVQSLQQPSIIIPPYVRARLTPSIFSFEVRWSLHSIRQEPIKYGKDTHPTARNAAFIPYFGSRVPIKTGFHYETPTRDPAYHRYILQTSTSPSHPFSTKLRRQHILRRKPGSWFIQCKIHTTLRSTLNS